MSQKKPLTFKDVFSELIKQDVIDKNSVEPTTIASQTAGIAHNTKLQRHTNANCKQTSSSSHLSTKTDSNNIQCLESDSDSSIPNPFETSDEWTPSCSDQSSESDNAADEHDECTSDKQRQDEVNSNHDDNDVTLAWNSIPQLNASLSPVQNSNDSDSVMSSEYPMLDNKSTAESVLTVAKRGSVKNAWDKRHSCKFCQKKVTKISSHMQRIHKNELEVVSILQMAKCSKERRNAWGELLNEGDFQHNYDVLESGSGELIPKYRSKTTSVNKLVACPLCKGFYKKDLLYLHVRRCKKSKVGHTTSRNNYCKQGKYLMPVPKNVSRGFNEGVLMKMREDDILRLIKNDHLILSFGERNFLKKDIDEHTADHVSGRMRELGRLLKIMRLKSKMKVSSLSKVLDPSNFDLLLDCVKILAEYDEHSNQFKKGSLALRLGYSLKTCAIILKSEAIKTDNEDLARQAERFCTLFTGDWYSCISASALQSLHRARYNQPRLLPAYSDIEKLHQLLSKKSKSDDYVTLTKATLCSITLFNRKRGGEVQRVKVEDFEKGMTNEQINHPEILEGLSEIEKKMVNFFSRIEIRGKFSRKVPILLTKAMIDNIKVMQIKRQELNINSPYLFATKTGSRPYRGSDIIREFAKEANVTNMSIFTFTNMRKQVATLSQSLEITMLEQDQLATFLGHDIRIHRNIYRQPIHILEKAKVAKILLAVNKGIDLPQNFDESVDDNDELEIDDQVDGTEESNAISSSDEDENYQATSSAADLFKNIPQTKDKHVRTPKANANSTLVMPETSNAASVLSTVKQGKVSQKGPCRGRKAFRRTVWSQEEKDAVQRQLSHCILANKVPQKPIILKAMSNEPSLNERSWKNVKDYVYNIIKKQKCLK